MAIYGLQVMTWVVGIGAWFLSKSLLFGHILWFKVEKIWSPPQKREGRAPPFPYKHWIFDKLGNGVDTTPVEILVFIGEGKSLKMKIYPKTKIHAKYEKHITFGPLPKRDRRGLFPSPIKPNYWWIRIWCWDHTGRDIGLIFGMYFSFGIHFQSAVPPLNPLWVLPFHLI